jgi:predicted nucleic acid-binding protein
MSADLAAFVDSNVLVYAVSNDEPESRAGREKSLCEASPKVVSPSVPK